MRAYYENHKDTIDRTAFFLLLIAAVLVFFKYLFAVFAPFFIGLLISLIMAPLMRLLTGKAKFKRGLSAVLCLILFAVAVGSLGTLIVTSLYRQAASLAEAAPSYVAYFSDKLDEALEGLGQWLSRMGVAYTLDRTALESAAIDFLPTLFGDGVRSQSLQIVSNVPSFLIGIILMFISAFFLMKDRAVVFGACARVCPAWMKRNLSLMRRGLSRAVGGYFRAQFSLMGIVAVVGVTGLFIVGNPYALVVGLMMALLDVLPFIGSGFVLFPMAFFSLIAGNYGQAIGLVILYAVIIVTRQVLEPKLLGRQIGVHPLLTLLCMYTGFRVFGVFGIIIGPSLVIIWKAVRETGYAERTEATEAPEGKQ